MSAFFMGAARGGGGTASAYEFPSHHLVTHGVVVGMTGSGKTGILTVMVEEALRNQIPVLMIDVKGDLPNLLLTLPAFTAEEMAPWVEQPPGATLEQALAMATEQVESRPKSLADWGISSRGAQKFAQQIAVRVITPGSSAGELLHVLSSLERRSPRWDDDPESARATLSAAISLVLRLVGREADPAKSREHVLLAVLAERRLLANQPADIAALLEDLEPPPLDRIGALPMDRFMTKKARRDLAAALNSLLASPTFASWRQGAPLDVGEWLKPQNGRTTATIVSAAHLDDDERALALGVLLEEVLSHVLWTTRVAVVAGARCLRRGVRLPAATPCGATNKKAARRPHEASPRLRRGRGDRDPEPDGPRLPRAFERGALVHRQAAD